MSINRDGQGVVDIVCAQFHALLLEVEDLKSRHKAREKEISLDVS